MITLKTLRLWARLRLVSIAVAAVSLVATRAASGSPIVFANEADFIAALGAHDLETFESRTLGNYGTSATFGPLSFASVLGPNSFNPVASSEIIINDAPVLGSRNSTPGGERYLEAWSGKSSFHDTMVMSRTDGSMQAWGATFTDFDLGSAEFRVDGILVGLLGPFSVAANNGNLMFVGFIAPDGTAFNEVSLTIGDRRYGIDDVRSFVAKDDLEVVEPATLLLLGTGLAAVRYRRRRKN